MQRFEVEVLGPKNNPCGFRKRFSSSLIIPGCTVNRFIYFIKRDISKYLHVDNDVISCQFCPIAINPAVLGAMDKSYVLYESQSFTISLTLGAKARTANLCRSICRI
jgi:hypothetical protein